MTAAGRDTAGADRDTRPPRRVLWLGGKPNGAPLMGWVPAVEHLPPEAVWWCREGDREWTRVQRGNG